MAIALTDQVVNLSKRAIERAHPNKSPQERSLLFIAVHYGKDLSRLVRDHLAIQVQATATPKKNGRLASRRQSGKSAKSR